jgi:nesprin-1
MLQLAGNGLDVESAEENLKSHMEFFSTECQLHSKLEELQGLVAKLDPLIKSTGKEELAQKMASLEERGQRIIQDSHAQSDLLQRYLEEFYALYFSKMNFTQKIVTHRGNILACKFTLLS